MSKLLFLAVLTATTLAAAEPSEPTPWNTGVDDAQRAQARALVDQGNELFVAKQHRTALERYAAALAIWKHPAIQFNIVRALLALDRPLEANDALDAAMAYGATPLGEAVYGEAVNYQKLLRQSLATVVIRCEPGTTASWDGAALQCPRHPLRMKPGKHALVAHRDGFVPLSRDVVIAAGDNGQIDVALVSLEAATVTRTRWHAWKPWALAASGAALVGLGGWIEFSARGLREDYGQALSRCTQACEPDPATRALHRSWVLRDRIGIGGMIAGGATLAAGVVLVVKNRPYKVLRPRVEVSAWKLDRGLGLVAGGSFR